GSWGSTLALIYAISHPERVKGLVLRGIFLCREEELKWFYQAGAHQIFPDAWDSYLELIPESERGDLMTAYHKRLTGKDEVLKLECAKRWSIWEGSTSRLYTDPDLIRKLGEEHMALAFARIECHYFMNKIFLESDN